MSKEAVRAKEQSLANIHKWRGQIRTPVATPEYAEGYDNVNWGGDSHEAMIADQEMAGD